MTELAQAFGSPLLWGGLGKGEMLLPSPLLSVEKLRWPEGPESKRASPRLPLTATLKKVGLAPSLGKHSKDDPCGEGSGELGKHDLRAGKLSLPLARSTIG